VRSPRELRACFATLRRAARPCAHRTSRKSRYRRQSRRSICAQAKVLQNTRALHQHTRPPAQTPCTGTPARARAGGQASLPRCHAHAERQAPSGDRHDINHRARRRTAAQARERHARALHRAGADRPGPGTTRGQMPFTTGAKAALERAGPRGRVGPPGDRARAPAARAGRGAGGCPRRRRHARGHACGRAAPSRCLAASCAPALRPRSDDRRWRRDRFGRRARRPVTRQAA
jgi:hypothetical protein